MSRILQSHWGNAREDVREVKKLIGERDVKSIYPIQDDFCMESYPCQGHQGVKITLKNGNVIEYECPSVSIGCIQKIIMGKADSHFREYTNGFSL